MDLVTLKKLKRPRLIEIAGHFRIKRMVLSQRIRWVNPKPC